MANLIAKKKLEANYTDHGHIALYFAGIQRQSNRQCSRGHNWRFSPVILIIIFIIIKTFTTIQTELREGKEITKKIEKLKN